MSTRTFSSELLITTRMQRVKIMLLERVLSLKVHVSLFLPLMFKSSRKERTFNSVIMKVSTSKEKIQVKSDSSKVLKPIALNQLKNSGQRNSLLKLKNFSSKDTLPLSRKQTEDSPMSKRKERSLTRQESLLIKLPIIQLFSFMTKLQRRTRLFGVPTLS